MQTDFAFKRQHIRMVSTNDRSSDAHCGRAGGCFHFSPLYEDCGTKFPAKQRLGFGWKKRRKTANACDSNAIEMRTESTAYFILAAKNALTEALVSWRNRAVNVGNRTGRIPSGQAVPRPARIRSDIRIDASTLSSRQVRNRFRSLSNASCVNNVASRGSSVSREAKL